MFLPTSNHDFSVSSGMEADFSPDGRLIAVSDPNGILKVIRIEDQKELASRGGPEEKLSKPHFSPDGKRVLALSAADMTVHVWGVENGKEALHLDLKEGLPPNAGAAPPTHVLFGPKGRSI